jgi:acetyltransferase-like isoleucine patch superfamily enzyme
MPPDIIQCLLIALYFFVSFCFTVLFFGVVHSQIVVRLILPEVEPGIYRGSKRRLVAVRISSDSIFQAMLKFFSFLPFIWGIFLFPYLMRLYGLKCDKNVHIATQTKIESAGLVEIGDNSFVGYNAMIIGHTNNLENRTIVVEPTKIGKRVTVGAYSIVSPGVTMCSKSVLGAKSTVTRGEQINPNEIWVGFPAKFLRKRSSSKGKE